MLKREMLLVALVACGSQGQADKPPAPSAPRTIRDTHGMQAYSVRVTCVAGGTRREMGTAFIHHSGHAITAAHVVKPCAPDTVELAKGSVAIPAHLLAIEDAEELAMLKPSQPALSPGTVGLRIAPADHPYAIGDALVTFGFPSGYLGVDGLLSVGYLAGVAPVNKRSQRLFFNGNFNNGNSGGAVIDVNTGLVVGVVSAKAGGLPPVLRGALAALAKRADGVPVKVMVDGQEKEIAPSDVVLMVVDHFNDNVQLGIGVMALPGDLRAFVARQGVTP